MRGVFVLHQVVGDCPPVEAASCVQANTTALTQSQSDNVGSSPNHTEPQFFICKWGKLDSNK